VRAAQIYSGPTPLIFLTGKKDYERPWRRHHMETIVIPVLQAQWRYLNKTVLGSQPHLTAAGYL